MNCMDIEQIKYNVKEQLSEKRYLHTLRVMKVALQLAKQYGVSLEKVQQAALIHDYLKEASPQELKMIIKTSNEQKDMLDYHSVLWHGPAAATITPATFGVTENEVIDAIRYHTTGRPCMGDVEKIVFIADYIEPARSFPGVDEVRLVAKQSLEEAIRKSLSNTITHLIQQRSTIHPLTFAAYNYYMSTKTS